MDFKVNQEIKGFRLAWEKQIHEIHTRALLFHHVKTGAPLVVFLNDDQEKLFNIAFRTPARDDSGVAHIIEHSVLCGSRLYPAKQPFMELFKGSLKTFLNAFTADDVTMYPVASVNNKDFLNLVRVYMDSVLFPKIYEKREIFEQEGWHYDIEVPEDEVVYKGVVYNEMKGAFSGPHRRMYAEMDKLMYPDTPYRFNSGGIPESIVNLTYEEYLDYHRRHYHPSNAYLFLYGAVDLIELLPVLSEEYLNLFDKTNPDTAFPLQAPLVNPAVKVAEYPIGEGEEVAGKTLLGLGYVHGTVLDPITTTAMAMLGDLLANSEGSPLRKKVMEARLGKVFSGSVNDSILQPHLVLFLMDTDPEALDALTAIVREEVERMASEGIDRKLLQGIINSHEFHLREPESSGMPKSLKHSWTALQSMIHGGDPLAFFQWDAIFAEIRQRAENGWFEQLLREIILDNTHRVVVTMKPKPGMATEIENRTRTELEAYKQSLTPEALENLKVHSRELRELQDRPDTPEDLATIPHLDLSDLSPEPVNLPLRVKREDGHQFYLHEANTNGIVYADWYFNLDTVSREDLPWVAVLGELLGKLDTRRHSYIDLDNELSIHIGAINFGANAYPDLTDPDNMTTKWTVYSKALKAKTGKMLELTSEILFETRFEDKERIREIVEELRSVLQMRVMNYGFEIAMERLRSYFSPVGQFEDDISGIGFYRFLNELLTDFDAKFDTLCQKMQVLLRTILNQNDLIVSITGETEEIDEFMRHREIVFDKLGTARFEVVPRLFLPNSLNEGLMAPINVQYCFQGYHFLRLGKKISGELVLLKSLVSNDFLHQKVRVQGGAYGAGMSLNRSGWLLFYSYRDPNLLDTYNAFAGIPQYIDSLDVAKRELEKHIIGTIAGLDKPRTPHAAGVEATESRIQGITREDMQQTRNEIIGATQADLRNLADLIREILAQKTLCCFGNEGMLKKNRDVFKTLVPVFGQSGE